MICQQVPTRVHTHRRGFDAPTCGRARNTITPGASCLVLAVRSVKSRKNMEFSAPRPHFLRFRTNVVKMLLRQHARSRGNLALVRRPTPLRASCTAATTRNGASMKKASTCVSSSDRERESTFSSESAQVAFYHGFGARAEPGAGARSEHEGTPTTA